MKLYEDETVEFAPGARCRSAVKNYVRKALKEDSDAQYLAYLEEMYKHGKQGLAENKATGISSTTTHFADHVFLKGLGLLAHGRLDVLEDVLESTKLHFNLRRTHLVTYLILLLPLPDSIAPLDFRGGIPFSTRSEIAYEWISKNSEAIQQWYRENKANLAWDTQEDRYILKSN